MTVIVHTHDVTNIKCQFNDLICSYSHFIALELIIRGGIFFIFLYAKSRSPQGNHYAAAKWGGR